MKIIVLLTYQNPFFFLFGLNKSLHVVNFASQVSLLIKLFRWLQVESWRVHDILIRVLVGFWLFLNLRCVLLDVICSFEAVFRVNVRSFARKHIFLVLHGSWTVVGPHARKLDIVLLSRRGEAGFRDREGALGVSWWIPRFDVQLGQRLQKVSWLRGQILEWVLLGLWCWSKGGGNRVGALFLFFGLLSLRDQLGHFIFRLFL